eukprot:gene7094-7307_t
MIEYKLGSAPLKLRWQEVVYHADGTKSLLSHQPLAALYPARTSTISSSQLLTSQLSLLDSLQLDEQQLGAAMGPGSGEDEDGESKTDSGVPIRHLTPAQRASMAVRTFNLKYVVALLESEEVVLAPFTHSRSSDSAAMRKLWAEQQDVTAQLLTSHFVFSIPLTAPPSFKTPMVAHKWVLRFEITLGKPKANRPGELVTEQLLWSLPLIVFPPPTDNAASL